MLEIEARILEFGKSGFWGSEAALTYFFDCLFKILVIIK